MVLKSFFSGKDKSRKKPGQLAPVVSDSPICDFFREGVYLKKELTERLVERAEKGAEFFYNYNESRIKLAFESFDKGMSLALFEIIYLLNTNEKWLEGHKYHIKRTVGNSVINDAEAVANLYVEDAPYGVRSIENLSPVFRGEFEAYIFKEYERKAIPKMNGKHLPIDGIYSIGSIGTIGHKNIASDLDLEVQYDLEPFLFDVNRWSDDTLKAALNKELQGLISRYYQKKQIDPSKADDAVKLKVKAFFKKGIASKYPILFKHFFDKNSNIVKEIKDNQNKKLRSELIRDTINLMKQNAKSALSKDIREKEGLLKNRIQIIQEYVQKKFPDEEIYLFPFSLHEFRKGYFGSTIESKESSGGAYELILNYETLMPGIYFSPNIPSHFLFPPDINNSSENFDKLIEYLRFGVVDIFSNLSNRIINQGPTPDLSLTYVAEHYSAVYWEAFKASYGNLPKATLNLLRYETLLEKRINKTIIQLIKDPHMLDELAFSADNIDEILTSRNIFSPQSVVQLEKEYPQLSYDPWWLRYKALKIAYGVPGLVAGIQRSELIEISANIDLAFALHIRLSDVLTKPGDQRKFEKHREQVLIKFLELVFPENSERRTKLHATFIGDVETVNVFEGDLRKIFQGCVERVHQKSSKFHVDEKSTREFQVWHHFYTKNFNPQNNVVSRSILNHLQTPRGRVQIGYKKESGWFFKSLQKESQVGKRFESSILNLLPDEVTLIKGTQFLHGLTYCVINGYYGIFSTGTLKETKTAVEYNRKYTDIGSKYDNHLAFVRPDQIERIMENIIKFNAPVKVGYLDCITKKREIISVMIFLNLLKYGRLSIMYRDSLDTIYVDTFDMPGFEKKAEQYMVSLQKLLKSMTIHKILGQFFRAKKIDLNKVNFYAWVNSNCVETTHAATNEVAKEQDLSTKFKEVIMSVHGQHAA
ncbi:hypothetical protein KJ966_13420 [bacterium]|nr:hypothetical protein [bacterium]